MPRSPRPTLGRLVLFAFAAAASLDAGSQPPGARVISTACFPEVKWAWSKPVAKTAKKGKPDRELMRPMDRRDLQQLIETSRAKPDEVGRFPRRREPSLARLNVIASDAAVVLSRAHLEETIAWMKSQPNPDMRHIERSMEMAQSLDRCGRLRYADFGGDPVFDAVRTLVLQHRKDLESTVFMPVAPPVNPAGRPVK